MNKRGVSWTLEQTLTVVGGVVSAVLIIFIVARFTSTEWGTMTFIAKDTAMLTDAILASPQDIQLMYPQPFTKWYGRLNNYSMQYFPFEPQENESTAFYYHFIRRKDITMVESTIALSSLFFIKDNTTFMIDNKPRIAMGETK
jgi:hypothetical protein